jgi:hypothetical protein
MPGVLCSWEYKENNRHHPYVSRQKTYAWKFLN